MRLILVVALAKSLKSFEITILTVQTLKLSEESKVPTDATIIIAPPQTPFLQNEVEKLHRFLSEENGRIIIFLDPRKQHGNNNLLYESGIIADDMFIFDKSKDSQASGGDLIIRHFVSHPIPSFPVDNQLFVFAGPSRPFHPDLGAPIDNHRTTTSLLTTSNNNWEERTCHKNIISLMRKLI